MPTLDQITMATEVLTQAVGNAEVDSCSPHKIKENFDLVSLIFRNIASFVVSWKIPVALFNKV